MVLAATSAFISPRPTRPCRRIRIQNVAEVIAWFRRQAAASAPSAAQSGLRAARPSDSQIAWLRHTATTAATARAMPATVPTRR